MPEKQMLMKKWGGRGCGTGTCCHADKSTRGISGSLQPKALTLVGLTHKWIDPQSFPFLPQNRFLVAKGNCVFAVVKGLAMGIFPL